jgi:serine/threonine protein kinase
MFIFQGIYFSQQAVFITSELCQGTLDQYINLSKVNGGLHTEQKMQMSKDVLAGLGYLHERDILHKNLRVWLCVINSFPRACTHFDAIWKMHSSSIFQDFKNSQHKLSM